MRLMSGDINVYWFHDTLTPGTVRAASYGTYHDSGAVVPDVGDIVRDFPGLYGALVTVRVVEVTRFGQGVTAFNVRVTDHQEES